MSDDGCFCKVAEQRLTKIEQKIDSLLEFKWKVTGMAIAVGAFTGLLGFMISKFGG